MSRTYKDIPRRVRALPGFGNDHIRPDHRRGQRGWLVEEHHYGCQHDSRGLSRNHLTVEQIEHEPAWCEEETTNHTALWSWSLFKDECVRRLSPKEGSTRAILVFKARTESITRSETYVADCDIDSTPYPAPMKCWRSVERAAGDHLYVSPPKKWARDQFYAPERRHIADGLHQMKRAFNTGGLDALDEFDDPWSPPSPSGLWGGGYID